MLCPQDDRLTAEEAACHPYFDEMQRNSEEGVSSQVVQTVGRALENLRTFNANNKMKQSCLGYLVQHFTSVNETIELERVFKQLDSSGDGLLSRDELLEGYRLLYGSDFNEQEVDALMEMADANGDGKLSYSEWMMTAVSRDKFLSAEKLEGVFSELDADGDKMISLAELTILLGAS